MSEVADCLRLLGDATRLRILHLLEQEPLTVAELQDILGLGQSTVSGHLGKLKQADVLHDVAEGSARRYRLRDDIDSLWTTTWATVAKLSQDDRAVKEDRLRLQALREAREQSWVERVAGSLDRAYAPGRTWEAIAHGFLQLTNLGMTADIGAGDGAMIGLIAPRCDQLICIDPSTAMREAGERRINAEGHPNVVYQAGSGETIPLADASCDTVLFLQSLQYIADPAQALRESRRVLRPGGSLLVLTLVAHSHPEAERYGHRHSGFTTDQLTGWVGDFADVTCFSLPAELRPPRFQTVVLTARVPASPTGR